MKEPLQGELEQLRRRVADLESVETAHQKSEEAFRRSVDQYETLLETAPVIMFHSNLKAVVTYVNRKFEEVTGYSREEILGRRWFVFGALSEETTKTLLQRMKQKLMGAPPRPMEVKVKRRDGTWIWVSGIGEVIRRGGRTVGIQVIAQDITVSKMADETIRLLAYYDKVTGLPNRELFNDRINLALAQAAREQHKLAVMMLDLDGFKDVNDTVGHRMGDALLKSVGERLVSCLRKSDTVARIGGDEFMVLLPKVSSSKDAVVVAQKIVESFQEPFVVSDRMMRVTTSIGIALYSDHGEDADALLMNADTAMYYVKQTGKDGYNVFGTARMRPFAEG